jgi:hypothetical protein
MCVAALLCGCGWCRQDNERKRTYKTKAETEAKKPVTATIVLTLLFISGEAAPGCWQGWCAGQKSGLQGARYTFLCSVVLVLFSQHQVQRLLDVWRRHGCCFPLLQSPCPCCSTGVTRRKSRQEWNEQRQAAEMPL